MPFKWEKLREVVCCLPWFLSHSSSVPPFFLPWLLLLWHSCGFSVHKGSQTHPGPRHVIHGIHSWPCRLPPSHLTPPTLWSPAGWTRSIFLWVTSLPTPSPPAPPPHGFSVPDTLGWLFPVCLSPGVCQSPGFWHPMPFLIFVGAP